jgi:hypothetical protein
MATVVLMPDLILLPYVSTEERNLQSADHQGYVTSSFQDVTCIVSIARIMKSAGHAPVIKVITQILI